MNCNIEEINEYDASPALAGNFRVVLGLIAMFFGFFYGVFSNEWGHGLGLLAFLGSPFIILTDKKRQR